MKKYFQKIIHRKKTAWPVFLFVLAVAAIGLVAYGSGGGGIRGSSLERGLVGYWTMNESDYNSATGKLSDKTPNNNEATNNNASFVSDRSGQAFSAMNFSGVNSNVAINYSPLLNFSNTDSFTMSVWVKKTSNPESGNVMGIFGASSGSGRFGIDYYFVGNTLRAGIRNGTNGQKSFEATAPNNLLSWTHVAFVYTPESADGMKLYINGNLANSATNIGFSNFSPGTALVLGNNFGLGGTPVSFIGDLDEARVYNRALSASEIKLLYDSQQAKLSGRSAEGGLVGYWSMDQDDYNTATQRLTDKTPQAKHGTNFGATFANDRFGQAGKAMSFDGSSSGITVDNFPLIFDNSISLSVWAYYNDDSRGIIFGNYDSFNDVNIEKHTSRRLRLYWNRGERDVFSNTNAFELNQWNHLVVIRNKELNRMEFYVNGELVNTVLNAGSDIASTSQTFRIGRDSRTGTTVTNGRMSDLRIYNKALTLEEVKSLYESHRPQITSNLQKGLVLDMPLKSDYMKSATILTDRTPYSNDSTLDGASVTDEFTQFNGIGQRVVTPYYQSDDPRNTTWVMNIKILQNNEGIGSFMTGNTGYHSIGFWSYNVSSPSNLRFGFRVVDAVPGAPAGTYVTPNFYPELDRWYHLVGVIDDNSVKLYIDGALYGSASHAVSTSMANVPVVINANQRISGSSVDKGNQYFSVSGVRIYNRALTDQEISLLFSRGR